MFRIWDTSPLEHFLFTRTCTPNRASTDISNDQLGMMVDMSAQGMGLRCKRFMCIVENGKFSDVTVDDGEGSRGVCAATAERVLDASPSRVSSSSRAPPPKPESTTPGQDGVGLYAELEREVRRRFKSRFGQETDVPQ